MRGVRVCVWKVCVRVRAVASARNPHPIYRTPPTLPMRAQPTRGFFAPMPRCRGEGGCWLQIEILPVRYEFEYHSW